jgi:hypothetical protein
VENLSVKLKALLEQAGLKVVTCTVLGKYVHVGISNKEQYNTAIDTVTRGLKAVRIIHLPQGADGKHLDGKSDHRFCAVLI